MTVQSQKQADTLVSRDEVYVTGILSRLADSPFYPTID